MMDRPVCPFVVDMLSSTRREIKRTIQRSNPNNQVGWATRNRGYVVRCGAGVVQSSPTQRGPLQCQISPSASRVNPTQTSRRCSTVRSSPVQCDAMQMRSDPIQGGPRR